jgi:hypothetical protein
MHIDRSNYEIWLIDWLDGNLSEIQVEQLQAFLNENPEILEEYSELTTFRLNPSLKSFTHKDRIKKKAAEISESQFEYLCVAFLEKDLSSGQQSELMEIIDLYPEKKKSFELIQKMRLFPEDITYTQKKKLSRRTVVQKLLRLSYIGLSAAAIIALAFITYISIPRKLPVKTDNTTQNITVVSPVKGPAGEFVFDNITTGKKDLPLKRQNKKLLTVSQKTPPAITEPVKDYLLQNVSAMRSVDNPTNLFNKIPVFFQIDLKGKTIPNNLIAFQPTFNMPVYDDGRSRLSKFISKTFREKILKEKSAKDTPLKGYEIAEVGVTGLNKLLGWEMALDKKNGDNGELKSVYFSSRLLKFNAPVKKSEPVQ